MKGIFFTILSFFTLCQCIQAQGGWNSKAPYGGGSINSSTAFTINGKGYMGTGFDANSGEAVNSFWQYDPLTDTWSQKADVIASPRGYTFGFSIGDNGYIGGGYDGENAMNDFYEYNSQNNTWLQKADVPGPARLGASTFTINGKGYVGLGFDLNAETDLSDFWSYNTVNNTWSAVANFAGPKRQGAVSFAVGSSGYVCTGYDYDNDVDFKDLWEYNEVTNTWAQKADLTGQQREFASAFAINGNGYVTCGYNYDDNVLLNDLWQYDVLNDSWSQKADMAGLARQFASAFAIGGKGYVVSGINFSESLDDLWEYDSESSNIPPVADAGDDITLVLPVNSTTLNGSGTDTDGTIVSYEWSQDVNNPSSVSISDPTIPNPEISGLVEGVYTFTLLVTDNGGETASDEVQVTVNPALNQDPVADAGEDIYLLVPANSTQLSGSGTDSDGVVTSYLWEQIGDTPSVAVISDATLPDPLLSELVEGVYSFSLTVTDDDGAFDVDTVLVIVEVPVNQAPSADAGSDIIIELPVTSTILNGAGVDPEGNPVTFEWTQIGNTPSVAVISEPNLASAEVSELIPGSYTFRLTVTDDLGLSEFDEVNVLVLDSVNQAPVANAGPDQTIISPSDSVRLDGSGSDIDGTIVSYAWVQVGTTPSLAVISDTTLANPDVTGLINGTYTFRLTVTDNEGEESSDEMNVFVNDTINEAPVALAGSDIIVIYPIDTAQLNGSGIDEDGTIEDYHWIQFDDEPSIATISDPNIANPVISGLTVEGVYRFILIVTDNEGATASDIVQIFVYDSVNNPPVAVAGINATVIYPIDTFAANGAGIDVDGTIVGYHWTQIGDQPSIAFISDTAISDPVISGLVTEGLYQFEFTVTDDDGAFATDTLSIFVYDSVNNLPTANAGSDQIILLPVNNATLSGSGSDEDGTIAGYLWEQVGDEPSLATITNNNSSLAEVSDLVKGVYLFVLTVTDNNGGTDSDTMRITVIDTTNSLPIANAGSDISITLPQDSVELAGGGSDTDGTIVAYAWDQVGEDPSVAIFSDSTIFNPVVSGLIEGTYTFVLKVTDNDGGTSIDTVLVTVNPAPNQAPIANAGADITILLPENSVVLDGSGTDTDGEIVSYAWAQVGNTPSVATITDEDTATPSITNLVVGTYTFVLTVTDNEGATGTDTVLVIVDTDNSTDGGVFKSYSIYPNPAPYGRIMLDAGTQIKIGTKATLINSSGKSLEKLMINAQKQELDLSAYPAGLYFIQFENGLSAKVIIMH